MKNKYRAIWISDLHLGTRGCKSDYLNSFLKHNSSEYLYLVGDIIDGWRLRSKWYWPQEHNNVIRKVLNKSKKGTEVIYITGNHDEFIRPYVTFGLNFGNVKILNSTVHESLDGRKLWVVHGDAFDGVTRYHKWVAILGDHAYNLLLWSNRHLNYFRAKFGLGYWSLSKYLKQKAKEAVNFIYKFEEAISFETKKRGYDGVICGHIHHPEIKKINDVMYYNDGDFVESCSALVENYDGTFEIIYWHRTD